MSSKWCIDYFLNEAGSDKNEKLYEEHLCDVHIKEYSDFINFRTKFAVGYSDEPKKERIQNFVSLFDYSMYNAMKTAEAKGYKADRISIHLCTLTFIDPEIDIDDQMPDTTTGIDWTRPTKAAFSRIYKKLDFLFNKIDGIISGARFSVNIAIGDSDKQQRKFLCPECVKEYENDE